MKVVIAIHNYEQLMNFTHRMQCDRGNPVSTVCRIIFKYVFMFVCVCVSVCVCVFF